MNRLINAYMRLNTGDQYLFAFESAQQLTEFLFLAANHPELPLDYLEFLRDYKFNPKEVFCKLDAQKNLFLVINGPWVSTILRETILMSIIVQLYNEIIDTNWTMDGQCEKINKKASNLLAHDCQFSDFGTRRRRSAATAR